MIRIDRDVLADFKDGTVKPVSVKLVVEGEGIGTVEIEVGRVLRVDLARVFEQPERLIISEPMRVTSSDMEQLVEMNVVLTSILADENGVLYHTKHTKPATEGEAPCPKTAP